MAGKTGTAQVREDVPDHNWFIGFAPADDPQIAVAVFVANGGGTGGDVSAPIARQVIAGLPRRAGGLMALSTGSLLAGRYEITAPIAIGGMGEVWKARDRVLDRIVAAKVLKSEYTGDPSFLARFRNEARHTAALTHPNIASVYDYGETVDDTGTQQLAFLVMEFVEGQPLVTILHDEGRCPSTGRCTCSSQSADGLSAAHRAGVVHRDIKPGNLMVRPDGVVKLTDFGIAQARDAAPLTRTGMVVGTAQYLSPEQAQGMEVTAASDVYSLGVVAYECLAGARPVRRRLPGGHRAGPHQPAAAAAAGRRARRPCGCWSSAPWPRTPPTGSPTAARSPRRSAGSPPAARSPPVGRAPATPPTQVVAGGPRRRAARTVLAAPARAPPVAGRRRRWARAPAPAGPMPPLQAPPEDDDDWVAGRRAGRTAGRGARSGSWLAAPLVLLLLLGGGAWYLLHGRQPRAATARRPPPTSATSQRRAPRAIVPRSDAATSAGRPTRSQAELEGLGSVVSAGDAADATCSREAGQELDAGDVVAAGPGGHDRARRRARSTLFVAAEAVRPTRTRRRADRARRPEAPPTTADRPDDHRGADDHGGDHRPTATTTTPPRRPRSARRRRRSSPPPTDGAGPRATAGAASGRGAAPE